MSILNDIKSLEIKRVKLLEELIGTRYMLRGKFKRNFRRCGKLTCWCATDEKGHPYHRITGMKNSKSFTKAIPKEEIPWTKNVTQAYRRFRKLRQQLRKLNEDQRLLLNKLEDDVIEKTKKLRDFL